MRYSAVIGLGFGDEGKGRVVDYLCSQISNPLVVRFSGGHQCGHTVLIDSVRHIFSNFGSGTLRGAPTYWSRHCTVEPIGLCNELISLVDKCTEPVIYIDDLCPVTTPYEIKKNRTLENGRIHAHGSCGVGFGATIQREEDHYHLYFMDLYYPSVLKAKLDNISHHYGYRLDVEEFRKHCDMVVNNTNIARASQLPRSTNYIYEGSQGLLLDQNYGFFPNVTRANTGSTNLPDEDFEYYLVTRAYQTRHGNGFMSNEHIPFEITDNPIETNQTHPYQGEFRKSMLDVDLLEYAINRDERIRTSNKKRLVITCLDHLDRKEFGGSRYKYTYKGNMRICNDAKTFVEGIAKILRIDKIYTSFNNKGDINEAQ